MSIIDLLNKKMAEYHIVCHDVIIPDGIIHRFANHGKGKANCWYVLHCYSGSFGDWQSDIKEKFSYNKSQKISSSCYTYNHKRIAKSKLKNQQNNVAKIALEIIFRSKQVTENHYLFRKNIHDYPVLYSKNHIIVPLQDISGKIWNLQKIFNDGQKYFLKNGKKKFCYHMIGQKKESKALYFCEGYSTAISIHLALDQNVIMVIDAYNMRYVIEKFRAKYPKINIFICADNDAYSARNIGKEQAEKAAQLYDCKVILPRFTSNIESKPTDFNDLHQLEGLEVVKKQINNINEYNNE